MVSKDESKQQIKLLIEKYNRVKDAGKINTYTEEATKTDFILPLFRALGWDIENSNEVTKEEKISRKRVDYGFRIKEITQYFVEAKPLDANLDSKKYIEQAIDYSYHKGVTWAILTNFVTLKIFNAEWKNANLNQNHFKTLSYFELLDRHEELWMISKEGFQQKLLDTMALKWGKKIKRMPIDEQLEMDFTRFRELLLKNITKLNQSKNLKEEDLDESVQRILDRLIFIRNCEDRELEQQILISNYREWSSKGQGQLIKSLRETFTYFDKQYNSKIFAKHLCDELDIDNEVLKDIIEGLYSTKDNLIHYNFGDIEADVLGNIYEQYLSNILKKTKQRATITISSAHRKEQGIYYTPTYIVDFIVRNTLGELLKKKKIDASKIKVLDPACGSGSFLIKTFDILYEYYRKLDGESEQTQLDFSEIGPMYSRKLQILERNIFGVDLDKQAVEIAQLNLLLKIAEKGKRLPVLEKNIKRGNSIIDDKEIAKENAFIWNEQFKEIIDNTDTGGFDIIIGNPPYGAELNEQERTFISDKYITAKSYKNSALIFIERAYNLLKDGGILGFIIPKSIAYSQSWKPCRDFIKNDLISIVDVSKAFKDVLLEQVIIILQKKSNTKTYKIESIDGSSSYILEKKYVTKTDSLIIHNDPIDFEIFKKMNSIPLEMKDISKTSRGLPFQKYISEEKSDFKVFRGANISRYYLSDNNEYLHNIDKENKKVKFLMQPKILSQRIVAHVTGPIPVL